jgi:hypothetical protein
VEFVSTQGIAAGEIMAFRARCRLIIEESRMLAGRALFHVKQSMNRISLKPGVAGWGQGGGRLAGGF